MLLAQSEMEEENRVSVFIGNIDNEEDFDDYLADEFSSDFGFKIDQDFAPECDVGKILPVAKLLDGFSMADTYAAEIVKLAKAKGIEKASCAIVFFEFDYDPTIMNRKNSGKVSFIGSVEFPGFEQ